MEQWVRTRTLGDMSEPTILQVEDDDSIGRALQGALTAQGLQVEWVTTAAAALGLVATEPVKLVLLDLGLPGLNGLEVAKRIRQQPTLESIVLVAVTGYGQESDRQRSLEAGFDHHLIKPADFGKLQKILATIPKKVNATPATRTSCSAN